MKKFLVVIGILFVIFCGFIIYDNYYKEDSLRLVIEEERIDIDSIYIYGTHLNIEGNYSISEDSDLVLYNGEFLSYNINIDGDRFNISNLINDGIYLDEIPVGEYYLFLRVRYVDDNEEEQYKYYAINNVSDYKSTEYYSMSNYNKKIIIDNEDSYPTVKLSVSNNKNTDNVYDIVIDPGHGGMDGGASRNGYKESDLTMEIANKLKDKLESDGFKVMLTHTDGQLSLDEKLPEYGNGGRAVIPREIKAKYLFSIHLNSSTYTSVKGIELYTAMNINYDLAKMLVKNITTLTNSDYSNNKINKMFDGIYSRNFTQDEIDSSIEDYNDRGLNPYDISTNSNYYYIIRETGGIVTGAYVDNRNDKITGNPYVLSNIGTEAYLLELGYLSNKDNLNNIINNMDKYVEGIAVSINSLYKEN